MSASDALVYPYFVQFNSTAQGEEGTNLAFPFLVVHEGENQEMDGWVLAHDERNSAGLSDGLNWRSNIGRGNPGQDGSWSDIPRKGVPA